MDYNKISGGEAKVIAYPNLTLNKKGKKKAYIHMKQMKEQRRLRFQIRMLD